MKKFIQLFQYDAEKNVLTKMTPQNSIWNDEMRALFVSRSIPRYYEYIIFTGNNLSLCTIYITNISANQLCQQHTYNYSRP